METSSELNSIHRRRHRRHRPWYKKLLRAVRPSRFPSARYHFIFLVLILAALYIGLFVVPDLGSGMLPAP